MLKQLSILLVLLVCSTSAFAENVNAKSFDSTFDVIWHHDSEYEPVVFWNNNAVTYRVKKVSSSHKHLSEVFDKDWVYEGITVVAMQRFVKHEANLNLVYMSDSLWVFSNDKDEEIHIWLG